LGSVEMRLLFAALLPLIMAAQTVAVCSDDAVSPPSTAELRRVLEKMPGEPALNEHFPLCPGDYFGKSATLFDALGDREGTSEAVCAKQPSACLTECLLGKNSDSCFNLARVIQHSEEVKGPINAERLFALSCAASKPSACTNRAAGMRNGRYEGDPSLEWPEEKRNSCLMRTFQLSCGKGDSWGCAMLGQAWQIGEGAQANTEKAKAAFNRACELAPDFASCEFANSMMEITSDQ
jgi:TPR repeat protein